MGMGMKGQIKIRYRLHCEDWAEEIYLYDSDDGSKLGHGLCELLGSVWTKPTVEREGIHMVMDQATFNRVAYECALFCVNIEESLEMMEEFDILWFAERYQHYIPVYFSSQEKSVPEEPAPGIPDDPMIMF